MKIETMARVVPVGTDVVTGDAFRDDEASEQDSEPREFATISYGNVVHRVAFTTRDLLIGSTIYPKVAGSRSRQVISGAGKIVGMEVTLPIDHAFVRRYVQLATPPKGVTIEVSRQQARSGLVESICKGPVTGMSVDDLGSEATFEFKSGAMFLKVIPNTTVSTKCSRVLFGPTCKAIRANALVSTNVINVDGRDILVDLGDVNKVGAPPGTTPWAQGGTVTHLATGEVMTVGDQVDQGLPSTMTHLFMQAPIVGMKNGDAVEIDAGCDQEIDTCDVKFLNRQNFGGLPELKPQGYSIAVLTPMDRE